MTKKEISLKDVMPMSEFGKVRAERRRKLMPTKRKRRVHVGPWATFYFESYETMWFQVHEMLWIEGGGDAQLPGELAAYNPLIPKGRELVATLMFEVEDPGERERLLTTLVGVEKTIGLTVAGQRISGIVEEEVGQARSDGKVSSVQFVHFPFTDEQVTVFRRNSDSITLQINHPSYVHESTLDAAVRNELALDFEVL
tara:strand:- start:160 stop:753 length:594 start_codon:yes stop_codon:yes gene_type:complete